MLSIKLFSVFLGFFISKVTGWPSVSSQRNPGKNVVPGHYHPRVLYETYGEGTELPSGFSKRTVEETAISFVMRKLGVSNSQVTHRVGFSSDITDHSYFNQVHNGVPFVNAVANVAMKDGKVVAFGSSFVKSDTIAPSQPTVNKKDAIAAAEAALNCGYNSHPITTQYLAKPDGSVALVHVIEVRNDETGEWYQAHVDAHSGKLISTVNYVSHATYTAVPITKNSLLDGQSMLVDPQDMAASPNGWHQDAQQSYNFTRGNNGYASRDTHFTAESSKRKYDYPYKTGRNPNSVTNPDAAIVNAFYIMNTVHDFTYRYGFNENTFNFQMSNFNRGGQENDGVIVSVNSRASFHDAQFATPPDGESGICTLFLFDETTPRRTSAMDNSVLVHELGHGVSDRLVGGGTAICLTTITAKGLAEGWSDSLADWTEQTSGITKDFTLGKYLRPSRANGQRRYPYSTSVTVNPLKYSDAVQADEPHEIGEVWANMLHSVYASLVDKHGYSQDAMTKPSGNGGNVIFMHLFIRSLIHVPCNPDFFFARDGLIQADKDRYNGQNRCLLWGVFASRGLGSDADGTTEGFQLPFDCP